MTKTRTVHPKVFLLTFFQKLIQMGHRPLAWAWASDLDLPALRGKLLQAKLLFRHRPAIQSTWPKDARIIRTLRANSLAVMNSTVYHAKNPMTVWHSKLSSSPRQGNETKSTDQMTIQDVLSRLKAKKVLSKSAHDFQLFESHENSCH